MNNSMVGRPNYDSEPQSKLLVIGPFVLIVLSEMAKLRLIDSIVNRLSPPDLALGEKLTLKEDWGWRHLSLPP